MKSVDVFVMWSQIKLITTTWHYCLGNSFGEKVQYITEVVVTQKGVIAAAKYHTHTCTYTHILTPSNSKNLQEKSSDIRCLKNKETEGR